MLSGFVLGECLEWMYPGWLFFAAAAVLVAAAWLAEKRWGRSFRLLLLFSCVGFLVLALQEKAFVYDGRLTTGDELAGEGRGRLFRAEEKGEYAALWLDKVEIREAESGSGEALRGIVINLPVQEFEKLSVQEGDWLAFKGNLFRFDTASVPGQFDQESYNRSWKKDYRFWADEIEVEQKSPSLLKPYLRKLRELLCSQIDSLCYSEEDAGILKAVLLGDKGDMEDEIVRLYQKNGTSHVLTISGLHISLIGNAVLFIIAWAVGRGWVSYLVSCLVVFLYVAMIQGGASAQRALVMFVVMLGARLSGRKYDMLSSMSLAALCILFQYPGQLFQAGFQLSFGAVLGLAWVVPEVKKILRRGKGGRFANAVIPAASLQMILFPATAWHFYEISPYGLFLNLLVIPLVPWLVLTSLAGLALGFLLPFAGRIAMGSAHMILWFYKTLMEWGEQLPGAVLLTGKPPLAQLLAYGMLLLAGLFWMAGRSRRYQKSILALTAALILPLLFYHPSSGLEAAFLDVGQGECLVMVLPDGTVVMVDGGSTSESRVGTYRIIPYLKAKRIGEVDYCIVTHPDEDHISGIREMMEAMEGRGGGYGGNVKLSNLILSHTLLGGDEAAEGLAGLAGEKQIPVYPLKAGMKLQAGEVGILCIHPAAEFQDADRNQHSLTLELTWGDFAMMITGDGGEKAEERIVDYIKGTGGIKHYHVWSVAHHGSATSTSQKLADQIRVDAAMISCGKNNRYGHPSQTVLDRLEEKGSRIYRTDQAGTIVVKVKFDRMKILCYTK